MTNAPSLADDRMAAATLTMPNALAGADVSRRAADFFELAKPKIAAMALVTVAVGFLLGGAPSPNLEALIHTLIGTALVAAGGSSLNHWLERRIDARMARTRKRPIPAGRLHAAEALAFGISLTLAGITYLAVAIPYASATLAAAATALLYVAVYTPLKRFTAWNTVVGAIPGALPPVIGWCAARGDLTLEAAALFLILFVWQLPHFFSIAWLYRQDYARGRLRMLPAADHPDGRWTGRATLATCLLLAAAATLPFILQAAGWLYLAGSLVLAAFFLARSARFALARTDATARGVLRGSLIYLAGLMLLLVVDGLLPRYFH